MTTPNIKYGLHELKLILDPGHGWLRVPRDDVEASGYRPSRYSYRSSEYIYLEEDWDIQGFFEALGVAPELVGPTVSYVSHLDRTPEDSFVRDLPRCGSGNQPMTVTY
jgi:hypothetical protein